MNTESLEPAIAIRIQKWLDGAYDAKTKEEIKHLLKENPKSLSDAFFKDLAFGTGGMRGIMGVGTNRMNIYTLGKAAQGLANYIQKQPEKEGGHSVFIGYDVRHQSREFAEETAKILAANQIRAYLTKEVAPTPFVSFGCRYHGCTAAVMVTASHNPPEYNGFKVYWSDGAQVVPPHDTAIIEEVRKIQSLEEIKKGEDLSSSFIEAIGEELTEKYIKAILKLKLLEPFPLKIIYTNLHGTGLYYLPRALKSWGYEDVSLVEKQASLDGNFPFAPSPNPEEEKALELGKNLLQIRKADLLLASDPDADRIAASVVDKGKVVSLTGNQTACICVHHILERLTLNENLPSNAAFIKTIVTTELFRKIVESYERTCIDVLTGFKYIGEKIAEWEVSFEGFQYIFGAEESYGYLFGTYVRDKDAISSGCLIAEIAAFAKKQNLTLVDRLYQIYQKYGIYRENLTNLKFSDSKEGVAQMRSILKKLRETPPKEIGGSKVCVIEDYEAKTSFNVQTKESTPISLPKSNVLRYFLSDETKIVIRPSGTEPKIKIYFEVSSKDFSDIDEGILFLDQKLSKLNDAFQHEL